MSTDPERLDQIEQQQKLLAITAIVVSITQALILGRILA